MNYFLGYDNGHPMFIGGENHGKRVRVPSDYTHYELPVRREMGSPRRSFDVADYWDSGTPMPMKSERYRQEWFLAEGRKFRLYIHEQLPTHAALMLLLSLAGENPALVKRIQHLEEENRVLKKMLGIMAGG